MSEHRTLRFESFEFYDINDDAEKVRLLALTNIGTWFTDIRIDDQTVLHNDKVERREKLFREYVYNALACKLEPAEVCFGD